MLERRRECKKKPFIGSIDVIKAYDTVWIDGLFVKLRKVGVRGKMWRVLLDWYRGGRSVVGVEGIDTNDFELKQGVKQGSVVAPLLYALFVDGVVDELKKEGLGVTEGGVWVGALLYADDMVLIADNEWELKKMFKIVEKYSRMWRFRISGKKTKVLVCGETKKERGCRRERMEAMDECMELGWWIGGMKGERVEEVDFFKYLGVEIEREGKWCRVVER